MHRYALTSSGARVKRRRYRGDKQSGIVNVDRFDEDYLDRWVQFTVIANANEIRFSFGHETVTIEGPLEMDGANKIVIAPGTKLRNLRLDVSK